VATFEPQAALLQDSTLEVALKLLDDEARQSTCFLQALAEAGPVLGDGLVENRLLRLVTDVAVLAPGCVRRPVLAGRPLAPQHRLSLADFPGHFGAERWGPKHLGHRSA